MRIQPENPSEDRSVEMSDIDRADQATPVDPDEETLDLHDLARGSGAPVIASADPADVYEQHVPVAEGDDYDYS